MALINKNITQAKAIAQNHRRIATKAKCEVEQSDTKLSIDRMMSIPTYQEEAIVRRDAVMAVNTEVKAEIETCDCTEDMDKQLAKL
jgi:hypothetical protein